jgi:predicted Kef-type K+ transport protein
MGCRGGTLGNTPWQSAAPARPFACLFFASIGMLINPQLVFQNLGIILSLVTLIMVGKAAIILPIVLKFGYSLKTAVLTSFRSEPDW